MTVANATPARPDVIHDPDISLHQKAVWMGVEEPWSPLGMSNLVEDETGVEYPSTHQASSLTDEEVCPDPQETSPRVDSHKRTQDSRKQRKPRGKGRKRRRNRNRLSVKEEEDHLKILYVNINGQTKRLWPEIEQRTKKSNAGVVASLKPTGGRGTED